MGLYKVQVKLGSQFKQEQVHNVGLVTTVPVTGKQINLATSTVDVINWNRIIPGATGIWIPIDPENP